MNESNTPPSPNDMGRPPVSTQAMSSPPPPPPGYLPPAYPAPPAQKGVVTKVLTSVVATLFILSILANIYLAFIVFSLTAGASEMEYRSGSSEQRVVIVPIEGGIDAVMEDYVTKSFKALKKSPPAAIVLRIDSGGGGVTASDQIWHTISQFKTDHPDTKIIASFGGVAASGGYYIATPADYIFCEQTGITGSIGVMAQIPALEDMIGLIGVEMNTLVADGSDRKAVANDLFQNWTNEEGELTQAGEMNQQVLKNLLNSAWDRFVQVVDEGRDTLDLDQVRELASGDIFTAQEALDNQLIDDIGYLDDAVDKAIEMAGLPAEDTRVTEVRRGGGGLLGLLGASTSNDGIDVTDLSAEGVRTWMQELGEVKLSYRVQYE
ncbi:S49 family peptidase [Algisphaera agarilytica]|uniref:Protease-4 n=1 Tax=Algisphaera agarilytica TaxID=1385975 RepID=A0A7X0LLN6_9BACT|nr:S49 family peptidase [Algisphaera agarilytica]MBB6431099.1 protease-4 [Algisphaera agarilytica]